MDPRRVLGVGPTATTAEVRSAYRRLHGRLHPDAGGSAGLTRLVTAAYQAVLDGGRSARDGDFDPYAVLGVRPGAAEDEVRGAFRRLVRLVHPDRGGNDELFRIVDTSYDLVTDPLARAERRTGVKYDPPPPPPPPGPFEPRSPEQRRYEPRWRSWSTIGTGTVVLLAEALVLVALGVALREASSQSLTPIALLILPASVFAARPAYAAVRRGITQLRAARAQVVAEDLDAFLFERCLDAPVGRERDDVLYAEYRSWCAQRSCSPLSMLVFVEYLRSLGLLYVSASSWDNGVIVGIRLRD